ncbi:hypothetical protein HBI56_203190 [Parastagonospora nodorum]|uniref:Uncharacterized protein n=1 Tax=Phaeosphaeria nodorum (strain SN15 / ATCC MYA-4574 / FGSC 10173) TaxID=321614 RepID=A0A7U2I6S7_PHANO|nr:hypothetical protein HBH56_142880 [Parastagonospora nodorum]QRD01533.1 hypothetical protein JI435_416920 [Parastagonospora nodorum SN15]KAH3927718.1 hypothetical protein HBH54_148070 [Parastagonospora nodorum]KAH3947945.1 hypothetical protein HBH53_108110 [Parastagonospora nodorum]KAH3962081.1 hypothetical protein HBH51_178900 [Parastagonospora nodorum]
MHLAIHPGWVKWVTSRYGAGSRSCSSPAMQHNDGFGVVSIVRLKQQALDPLQSVHSA